MKHPFLRFLLTVFASLAIFACSDDNASAPETYSISGTVHQAGTSNVVADADVIAQRHDDGVEVGRTVTGSDGRFLLKGLPAGLTDVRIEATGYAPVFFPSMDAKSERGALSNMSVQLSSMDSCCSGVLELTVKNASGERLVNKPVVIKRAGQAIADPRTNENGVVVVDSLCAGEYSVRIAIDGYRVYEAVFVINSTCDPVQLTAVMQNENSGCCDGVLTVIVKDPNGNSVAGAQVRVWKNGAILRTTFTDTTGTAVFTDLCRGQYGADVMKTGLTNREFTFTVEEGCPPVTKNIVVESLGCCTGVFTLGVRDGNGNPIQGAKVLVRRGNTVIEDPVTNANGQIMVDGLCRGEYNYRISKDGYSVVEGMFAINELCEPVTREATLSGSQVCCSGVFTMVIRDATGNPIPGVKVVVRKGGVVIEDPVTNAQGHIGIDGLCKGEYTYRASKEGYGVIEGSFAINAACDPVTVEATMQGNNVCCSGVFTLVVRDGNGNPIPDTKVIIKKGGTAIADPRTNAEGRIVVDGLCAGEYVYIISKEGYTPVDGSFAIDQNCTPVTREATLTGFCCTGVLTVTVTDSSSAPIEGVTVKVWRNGAVLRTSQTNAQGVAIFDGLCKGEYGVSALKTGYATREFQFAIGPDCGPYSKTLILAP